MNLYSNTPNPMILIYLIFLFQKRRERGRISIKGIRLVEPAALNLDGDSVAPDVSIQTDFK